MKRLLLRTTLALFALSALGLAVLLTTGAGARWLAGLAQARVPGLSIATVDGSLASGLRLQDLRWRDARTTVQVGTAQVAANLPGLLFGRIQLSAVLASDVDVVIAPSGDATPGESGAVIDLPVLRIALLSVDRGRVQVGEQSVRFESLRGALSMQESRIEIDALNLNGPAGAASGRLALDLARDLPLDAAALTLAWRDASGIEWRGRLDASTEDGAQTFGAELEAPMQVSLRAAIDPASQIATLALRAPAQSAAALGFDARLAANLDTQYREGIWTPRGEFAIDEQRVLVDAGTLSTSDGAVRLAGLQLSAADHGALRIDGLAPLAATGRWDLAVDAAGLQVPRADAGPLRIDGRIAITGEAATPRIAPDLRLAAQGLPAATLTGVLAWGEGQVAAQGLRLDLGRGSATADGTLSFGAPATLDVLLSAIDPALFAADWPGAVDARLQFDGALRDGRPEGTLVLESLGGTLRGESLEGRARVLLGAGGWREGDALVSFGDARIEARASAAGTRVDAEATVPDLARLLSGSAGAVTVRWTRDDGDRIEVDGRGLQVGALVLGTVKATARLGSGADPTLALALQASGLQLAGQDLGLLSVLADGTRSAHVLALRQSGSGSRANLRLDGGWRDGDWRGRIEQLDADGGGATLRLREAVALRAGAAGAELASTCLDITGGRLCIAARHVDGSGELEATLDGLSLAALRRWIADDRVPALEGLASGVATASWSDGALGSATLRLESPRGLARLPRRPDLDLGYRDLLLEGRWDGTTGRLDGGAALVPDGRVDLAAELVSIDGRLGWDAAVDLRVSDLSGIEAFTTSIAEPEGELRGQLRLRGGALPASTSGALALTGFTAQVPNQALRLRDGVLVLAGVPGQLVLRGSVVSGDGTLTIDGRIDRDDPVPAILRIGGSAVRVSNTPDLSLLASPQLTLALRDGRWQLDGTLDIPRARIDASKLETGADRSPDIVVVDDPEPADPRRPWRARVRVTLGEDVRLTGFGFAGSLAGALDISQRQGAQALASGEVTLQGRYDAYGQRLAIERGGLRWANSPIAEPTLDLRAERKVRGETVALEVRGSALRPDSRVVAGPGVSDSDALALLVTGRPLNRAGAEDRERLSDAAAALGAVGSEMLTRGLRGRLGLDEIGISSDTRLDGEAFTVGKYLSPRLYVGYGIGILTRGEVFTVRYLVTDRIEVEANAGATQRAAVNWRIER